MDGKNLGDGMIAEAYRQARLCVAVDLLFSYLEHMTPEERKTASATIWAKHAVDPYPALTEALPLFYALCKATGGQVPEAFERVYDQQGDVAVLKRYIRANREKFYPVNEGQKP